MKHGTRTAYSYGCRCDICRAENAENSRRVRQADPEAAKRHRRAQQRKGSAYIRQRRQELGPCRHCGSDEDLAFDHIDPSTKRKSVGMMAKYGAEAIEAEIAKCQVLCRTCHIKKTRANGDMAAGKARVKATA